MSSPKFLKVGNFLYHDTRKSGKIKSNKQVKNLLVKVPTAFIPRSMIDTQRRSIGCQETLMSLPNLIQNERFFEFCHARKKPRSTDQLQKIATQNWCGSWKGHCSINLATLAAVTNRGLSTYHFHHKGKQYIQPKSPQRIERSPYLLLWLILQQPLSINSTLSPRQDFHSFWSFFFLFFF